MLGDTAVAIHPEDARYAGLASKAVVLPIMQRYGNAHSFLEIIPISASTRENLDLLLDKLFDYLPEGEPLYEAEQITDLFDSKKWKRIVLIAGIRERMLLVSDVPPDMRGAGITMVIAGILAHPHDEVQHLYLVFSL
jgi:hypothetical protein